MKIEEIRIQEAGLGGRHTQKRVRKLAKDEPLPEGAKKVSDDTPESDWQPVEEGA
jgi:hypothetical protein